MKLIEDLPDEIVNPGDYSDQYVEQEVRSFFEQQFGQYDAFDQFAGPIDEGYSNSHTERHFELEYGSDEERVREHLETADGNEGN